MMRQSCQTADADDDDYSDEEDNSDDEDNGGLRWTANNLKVFCCSSTEFLKLSGKLSKDGPAQVGTNQLCLWSVNNYSSCETYIHLPLK